MKTVLLCCVLLSFFVPNAQDMHYGLKTGYNSFGVKLILNPGSDLEALSGYYIGVFAIKELSDIFDITADLQYIKVNDKDNNTSVLALPLAFRFSPADKLAVYLGPQFELLLDQEAKDTKSFGFAFGFGLSFNLSKTVFLDSRYAIGLFNRLEDDVETGVSDVDLRFNYFQIGVAYKFY